MDLQRARHSGLDDQARVVELEHGMLGAAKHPVDLRAGEPPDQPAAGHSTEDIIVAEGDPTDAAADERRAEVSNDGFDFRKLGHQRRSGRDRNRPFHGRVNAAVIGVVASDCEGVLEGRAGSQIAGEK